MSLIEIEIGILGCLVIGIWFGELYWELKATKINVYMRPWQNHSPENLEGEIWKEIGGYEGYYEISNFGRVRSITRVITKNNKWKSGTISVLFPSKIKYSRANIRGYIQLNLFKNGNYKTHLVHILVAKHFVDNPKNYTQVLHIDDDPGNPHYSNLKWGTQSHNIQECADKGRGFIGSKNGNSKLKESDIPEIKRLLAEGVSAYRISKNYKISKHAILSIKNNKTWQHA